MLRHTPKKLLGTTVCLLIACSSVATAVAPAAARTAPEPASGKGFAYAGETTQGLPISFVLTKDRTKIKRLDVEWLALPTQCSTGLPYMSRTTFGAGSTKALAISPRKNFRHTFADNLTLPRVLTLEEQPVVRGTVGRTRAFGTFRATVVIRDGSGAEINRCQTEAITWTAIQ